MSQVKAPLKFKLLTARNGFVYFFSSYKRIVSFIILSFFGFALINALLDIDLLWTLIKLDIDIAFKLEAIRDVLFSTDGLPLPNVVAVYTMALIFGYVLAASFFVAFKQRAKTTKSGGIGIVFGILSGGCAACGTSLLAPLLTAIGITTTSAALSFALYLNLAGIVLLIYSAYKVSLVIAANKTN